MQNSKFKYKIKIISKTFYLLLVFLTLEFLLLNLDKVNASTLSLSIDPPITIIHTDSPETIVTPLTIQNLANEEVDLKIQLKSFRPKGENGEIEYSGEIPDLFDNIQIMDNDVAIENTTLAPKQKKSLNIKIYIPEYLNRSACPPSAVASGDCRWEHYFSVIFQSTNSFSDKSSHSVNQLGIATNILLSIGNKITPNASLEEFSTKVFYEKGPIPFTVRIKNDGKHLIQPQGKIILKNMFGQIVEEINLSKTNVLSDSIRAIPNAFYFQNPKSNPKNPVVLWKKDFLLGFYTANLSLSLSDAGPNTTKIIHFLVIPFQLLIIIAIALIAIIIVMGKFKEIYKQKSNTI